MKQRNQYQCINGSQFTNGGFSLVELMVSIGITALLMLGLVEIFGSNRAASDLQQGLSRLQENARYANFFVARHLRNAGYFPIAETLNPNLDFGVTFNTASIPPPVFNAVDGGGLNNDQLNIAFFSSEDCTGQLNPVLDVDGRNAIWRKEIRFEVDANNQLLFSCGYGTALIPFGGLPLQINQAPMLGGIEALQFQYGVDTDGDLVPNLYANTPQFNPGVNTVSVRVGMIVATTEAVAQIPDTQPINLLGVNYPATNDRRVRRPLVFTVHMRNLTP